MPYHDVFLSAMARYEAGDERSLQRKIGPSGIGEDCYHCLGAQIAQLPETEDRTFDWAKIKGHALHEYQEKVLRAWNTANGRERFLIEQKVTVGMIGDTVLDGTADCFDTDDGVVTDWKFPAERAFSEIQRGIIKPTYRVQPHAYGLGFENAGYDVKGTLILFFPVHSSKLNDAIPYYQPYDRGIAVSAIQRANDIHTLIEEKGVNYVLPRLHRKPGCWNCPRYAL